MNVLPWFSLFVCKCSVLYFSLINHPPQYKVVLFIAADEMVDRFRANFVIEGADPDIENSWSSLTIGNDHSLLLKFKVSKE